MITVFKVVCGGERDIAIEIKKSNERKVKERKYRSIKR